MDPFRGSASSSPTILKRLAPSVVPLECHQVSESDSAELRRRRNNQRPSSGDRRNIAFRERRARRRGDARRRPQSAARRCKRSLRRPSPCVKASTPEAVTKFGCGETGRSGSSTSAAVSALSSRVKATLIVSTSSRRFEIARRAFRAAERRSYRPRRPSAKASLISAEIFRSFRTTVHCSRSSVRCSGDAGRAPTKRSRGRPRAAGASRAPGPCACDLCFAVAAPRSSFADRA